VQRVIASLENQFNALVNQENELKQLFNTQKTSVIQSEKDVTAAVSTRLTVLPPKPAPVRRAPWQAGRARRHSCANSCWAGSAPRAQSSLESNWRSKSSRALRAACDRRDVADRMEAQSES